MVRDDPYITVPSFFRCPISLDVMKSPVSLCTGITYDRTSIQRWLDTGNNTCPATMQVLPTKDFVPNHTLHRLIQIWSDSVQTRSSSSESDSPNPNSLTRVQIHELIYRIKNNHKQNNEVCLRSIGKLTSFAKESDQNRKFLATIDQFSLLFIEILSEQTINVDFAEKVIQLWCLILPENGEKQNLAKLAIEKGCVSSMLLVLQQGCFDSRIASSKVLEMIATDYESKIHIAEHSEILSELFRLVSSENDWIAIEAGLSCLICISMPKRIRVRIVRLGAIKILGKMLYESELNAIIVEKVLKLVQMVLSCEEGRIEICEDEVCAEAIVKKLLKVSSIATERAVTILWSLCWLFRDEKAQEAVMKSNGLAKILLLMQCNCCQAVRQMAGDLLKIFRVNSKSCLSSYDTNNTHIMPF